MLRPLSSAGPAHRAQGETATSRGANSPGPVDGSGPSLAVWEDRPGAPRSRQMLVQVLALSLVVGTVAK